MGRWQQAGCILRGLREQRVWTVPRFAGELEAKATSIGRTVSVRDSLIRMIREWEAGDHRPRDYAILFILVYATDEELSARSIERGSELDGLMAAFNAMGVPVNRRRFLLESAAVVAGVTVGLAVPDGLEAQERLAWTLGHPASVDLKTIAHLRDTAVDLNARFATTPSSALLHAVSRQLAHVTFLRERASASRVREQLYEVEAQSATLLGGLIWDAVCRRDATTPALYYEQAVAASEHVREGWTGALPRIQQCLIAMHNRDLKCALNLATQAAECVGDGSSHVLAVESFAFMAETHALLGEERECRRALDHARSHLQSIGSDDPGFGRFGSGSSEWLAGFSGSCHLHLGDAKSAEAVLRKAADNLGSGAEKLKAELLGGLAVALIDQRDPEQGVVVLHQAIDLVELAWGACSMQQVFTAGRRLHPWIGEPFVAEVADRLLALGSAAS